MQLEPRARILVVDDEVGTGYALKLLLELDGYEVLLAADGDEAWRLACAEPIDWLITDICMPKLNGLDLIKRLKRQPRIFGVPVIVISSAEPAELDYARELGAQAALAKPLQYEHLLDCLQARAVATPPDDFNAMGTNGAGHFPSRL
jgi:CheY-like chemotaxis protein